MPLTTIDFDTLRERNTRSLERAGNRPGDVEELSSRQRHRIGTLLERRAAIEDFASTQNQREAYGIEAWHRDFVLLRDLRDEPESGLAGEELRRRVWSTIPNSRFKRFQELFCHPHQRVVPPFDSGPEGGIKFRGNLDFNALSLRGCLASPDLLPDALAHDLRLCTFTDEDRCRPERRILKKHAAIPRLKKIFEAAVPLQPRHHRVLLVAPATPAIETAYGPDVPGPDPETLGAILYVREEDRPADMPRKLLAQYFDSAYAAQRKTLHEANVHEREIDRLAELRIRLEEMNGLLNRDWRDPDRRATLRTQCVSLLEESIGALEACTNRYKVEAVDLLKEARGLKDALGRENVTATMTRMVAVVNRFQKRYEDMKPKGGFNQQDRMTLQQHLSEQELMLYRFRQSVIAGAHAIGAPNLALFQNQQLPMPAVRANGQGLLRRAGIQAGMLERVTLKPLNFFASSLRDQHRNLEDALFCQDRDRATHAVLTMHVLGKFQMVRSWFEHLKKDMVDAESISLARIRVFVDTLEEFIGAYQIYPDVLVEELRAPFEDLQNILARLRERTNAYKGQDIDIGSRTQIYRELKDLIDSYDVEEHARKLL